MDDDDSTTRKLLAEEVVREQRERERAREADLPTEEHTALRRADKAGYLADKLREQARSEQE